LPVVYQRHGKVAKFDCVQVRAQPFLGLPHQRTMKRGADGQQYRALGACSLGELNRPADGAGVAGDHDLIRRIEIGCADNFALGGLCQNRIQLSFR